MKLKTVVVDRMRWTRGSASKLKVKRKQQYCCLGFCALEAGMSPRAITGVGTPDQVAGAAKFRAAFPGLFSARGDSLESESLMESNDSDSFTSGKAREAEIKKLGQEAGIRFKFIN